MEEELLKLIHDYLKDIQIGIKLFEEEYGYAPRMVEARKRGLDLRGNNSQFEYYFHGIGFFIKKGDWEVDFDYGYKLRTDGFDEWRLKLYWETRKGTYPKILDEEYLQKNFFDLIKNKKIANTYPQDDLYYLDKK